MVAHRDVTAFTRAHARKGCNANALVTQVAYNPAATEATAKALKANLTATFKLE